MKNKKGMRKTKSERVFTTKEIAKLLGISYVRINDYVDNGWIFPSYHYYGAKEIRKMKVFDSKRVKEIVKWYKNYRRINNE